MDCACVAFYGDNVLRITAQEALDVFREDFPGQSLTGTMVTIQKASFELASSQPIVLAVKAFEWIGGRPLDPIGALRCIDLQDALKVWLLELI